MPRVRDSRNEHDKLIERIAKAAIERGNNDVRANIPGFPTPQEIMGRIPDVTWTRPDGTLVIREVDPPGKMSLTNHQPHRVLHEHARRTGADYRRLKYKKKT